MNLYLTHESHERLKKSFLNLRKQFIIDSSEIIKSLGYKESDLSVYSYYIVNEKIKKLIQNTSNGSKSQSIIYINSTMNDEVVRSLIKFAQSETSIDNVILMTERGFHEELYELFQEILFFPTIKRVHIVKCESFRSLDEDFTQDS